MSRQSPGQWTVEQIERSRLESAEGAAPELRRDPSAFAHAAQGENEPNNNRCRAAGDEPNGAVGGISSEGAGDIGTKRVGFVETKN